MSELIIADKEEITNIADAVRSKTGGTSLLSLSDMAEEINSLSGVDEETLNELNAAIATKADADDVLLKTKQTLTDEELSQVRKNLRFIGKDVDGQQFTVDGETLTASQNAEIFGDYENNIAIGQWSIAEGSGTVAKGRASHAEGAYSKALADGTHVEGYGTKASGYWSHAEGEMTVVSSYASHAEGSYTKMPDGTTRYGTASGYASHVEGGGSHASGSATHAEGIATDAGGKCAHSEGIYTAAMSQYQHAEGQANVIDTDNKYIHIAGNGTSPTDRSNAYTLDWSGNGWFAGDVYVGSTSGVDKDEGSKKLATEDTVLLKTVQDLTLEEQVQIRENMRFIGLTTTGMEFTVDGETVVANEGAEMFGDYTTNICTGNYSIAEGSENIVTGAMSHAEGQKNTITGSGSHAEGFRNNVSGNTSHAEGEYTVCSAYASHTEGTLFNMNDGSTRYGTASGYASHVEGAGCHASGQTAHAEGGATTASGKRAHAEGLYTIAASANQHVEGKANIADSAGKYIHIAGNGASLNERSNAYTLDWSGNGWFAGTVEATAIILKSSTEGSTKTFKITINDNGELAISENV